MEKEEVWFLSKKEEEVDWRKQIEESLEKTGFREKLNEDLIQRLILLEKESRFNEDSRKIERGLGNVFDYFEKYYADSHPELMLTEKQKGEGRMAAILHDIGKTGPDSATLDESKSIVKIFAKESFKDPNLSLEDMVSNNFSKEEAEEVTSHLKMMKINLQVTMREFWDMHAQWTHDILEKFPKNLTKSTRIIAGSHHFNKGINPYNLSESDVPFQSETIGLMEEYINAIGGRILMAMDQYEARRRRGDSDHKTAIEWVRENMENSKYFKNDKILPIILDAMDALGKTEEIFL